MSARAEVCSRALDLTDVILNVFENVNIENGVEQFIGSEICRSAKPRLDLLQGETAELIEQAGIRFQTDPTADSGGVANQGETRVGAKGCAHLEHVISHVRGQGR